MSHVESENSHMSTSKSVIKKKMTSIHNKISGMWKHVEDKVEKRKQMKNKMTIQKENDMEEFFDDLLNENSLNTNDSHIEEEEEELISKFNKKC